VKRSTGIPPNMNVPAVRSTLMRAHLKNPLERKMSSFAETKETFLRSEQASTESILPRRTQPDWRIVLEIASSEDISQSRICL